MDYPAQQQYQSVTRAFEKLRNLATDIGKTVVIGDHAAADAAKSFFFECYHFKDWLKKDPRIVDPQDIEDAISESPSLSMAADLCNSLKHAGLDKRKPPRSGQHLEHVNMAYSLDIPATIDPGVIRFDRNPSDGDTITISRSNRKGRPVATARVVFTLGGKKHDAIEIAVGCMTDWDAFLAAKGIHFS